MQQGGSVLARCVKEKHNMLKLTQLGKERHKGGPEPKADLHRGRAGVQASVQG